MEWKNFCKNSQIYFTKNNLSQESTSSKIKSLMLSFLKKSKTMNRLTFLEARCSIERWLLHHYNSILVKFFNSRKIMSIPGCQKMIQYTKLRELQGNILIHFSHQVTTESESSNRSGLRENQNFVKILRPFVLQDMKKQPARTSFKLLQSWCAATKKESMSINKISIKIREVR